MVRIGYLLLNSLLIDCIGLCSTFLRGLESVVLVEPDAQWRAITAWRIAEVANQPQLSKQAWNGGSDGCVRMSSHGHSLGFAHARLEGSPVHVADRFSMPVQGGSGSTGHQDVVRRHNHLLIDRGTVRSHFGVLFPSPMWVIARACAINSISESTRLEDVVIVRS